MVPSPAVSGPELVAFARECGGVVEREEERKGREGCGCNASKRRRRGEQ
jgi:hypothetical protein